MLAHWFEKDQQHESYTIAKLSEAINPVATQGLDHVHFFPKFLN